MKIFIDIGHPAHVHYFRNFISIMQEKGHSFFITARDKEVTHNLLNHYGLEFVSRGKGRSGILGKMLYVIEGDYKIYKYAKSFKPDLFLSFGSAYAAHAAKLLGKPHIAFDDTDHAKYEHILYAPFTDAILTPLWFNKEFGAKQIYFDSYMEICYLHPKYFEPDENIKQKLGLNNSDEYAILRLISWGASHDMGQSGLSDKAKAEVINLLEENNVKVFISSEKELPGHLEKYKLNVSPADLHSVLAKASIYIGEGSTTASECSVLGTPNVYINTLKVGNIQEQENKYKISFHQVNENEIIKTIQKLLPGIFSKEEWQKKKAAILNDKIDLTAFMVWFVENYPESYKMMKKDTGYQYKFR